MRKIDSGVCEICGDPAHVVSHIGPDSFLHERRIESRIVRNQHSYCNSHYQSLMDDLWNRVRRHLI
jgi:hypothetical protein